ncbi:ArsR/SmtB family transcription factor [Aquamicrobium ahrensii]|uniref:DNA-binding transcriptional ArsR family regulator n=1 Tax=Aquamicrobium ahrensii TaxID=469551 RepID=A0ABV2KJ27_9HYPH
MGSTQEIVTDQAAAFLALMANSKRLEILLLLVREELSVNTLAGLVGLSQSALSQHLAKLRSSGLVETRRDRQTIYYSCRSHSVARLLCLLEELFIEAATGTALPASS